jgi:hypothetical protein
MRGGRGVNRAGVRGLGDGVVRGRERSRDCGGVGHREMARVVLSIVGVEW